jgi:peptidyl-prolyl cis-trans isomerase C
MRRSLCLVLAAALALACHRKPTTPPDVIARVGDRMLTLADFKRYVDRNTGTDLAQITPEVSSALLDQFIEEIVLSEYAATHGVEVPTERVTAAVRNEAGATVVEKRDEMRRQRLIAELAGELPEATDDQVRAYYDQHPADFRSPEELRVRQILVHDEALANDIVSKLRKGGSFEDLSAQHSQAPNAKKGGDIGYISRGELPRMFEDVIFALPPGGVSDVIQTESSYHIFKVDERRKAGELDLATAAPVIRQRLREEGLRERMAKLAARSRTEVSITILTKRLPFKYSGTFPKSENE